MKKNYILPVLIVFLFGPAAFAKSTPTVSGNVKDAKSNPAAFANVILVNAGDSTVIKAALSNESGDYSFENIEAGKYIVLVSQIGNKYYSAPFMVDEGEDNTRVGIITLPDNALTLSEANVSAFKPFIEHRIDETIVNVENSIVDAGGTALEVLKRSPGITVDNEGNIRLSGKQGVQVMMDGKPTYLSPKDLYELLRNTSSDQLSQIVIMTNPSAKYDAAGNSGIINIKMRKKQNIGLNGNYRISYGQGVYPDFGSGINLNYRNEKINLFGGYDFMRAFYFERITNTRRFNEGNYTSSFEQRTFDKGGFYSNNFRAGIDYYASKKSTIGFLLKGNLFNNHDNTTAKTVIKNQSESPDSSYVTENINDSKWNTVSGNLNYVLKLDTLGSELSADADYAQYANASDFRFVTDHYFNDGTPNYTEISTDKQPADIDIRSFKIDYVKQFANKMKIEAGGKTSYVSTDNDVQYFNYVNDAAIVDTGKTNHFNYTENINAIYLNWAGEFKKLGIQLGLRGEQTRADGEQAIHNSSFHHDYFDLFPSVFLTYSFNARNQSKFSYSRRVDRPAYGQLNPFRYFIDPHNFYEGNPNLDPQFTQVFELAHTFMSMYSIGVNYSHTTDAMTQIADQVDSTHTTFLRTENLEMNDNYGITMSIPLHLTSWWESSNNFNLYSNEYSGISSAGAVDKRLTTFAFNTYNTFVFSKGWSFELSGFYNSAALYGTTVSNPVGSVSAGISKRFWKERFQLRVNINDIFHTDVTTSVIKYQNIDVNFRRVYDSQFIRLHLSYNFGKKTVARARQRAIGSQDEQNRINTNR
ncbi:MAG: outer membrane beta-barrel family protein [Bacteroidota bacterium]